MSSAILRERRTTIYRAVFLLIILFVVYWPALRGSYLWDDGRHVPDRPSFYTRKGLKLIWTQPGYTQQYYPLMFTTVWVEHHFWGARSTGYHVVTLMFHAANAILVALLLSELGFPAAWWVAYLFALHPIQAESVAWMTELKNTESTFFYLFALLMLMDFFGIYMPGHEAKRGPWLSYTIAFALYLCALFSKTVSCTLPVVALILLWYKKDRVRLADIWALGAFIAAGLILGLTTSGFEKDILGANGPAWDFTGYEHLLIAGRAFWFYIGKLLWPNPLNFTYALWDVHHFKEWNLVFPLGGLLLLAILWTLRRRWGKAPFAAMAIFAICLGPAFGFVHLYPMRYSFVADHFQYLAGICVIALAVALIMRVGRPASQVILSALCVIFAMATWSRAHVFHDPESLYRDILKKDPGSLMAMDNLAVTLMMNGALPEAHALAARSLQERPDDMDAQLQMGYLLLDYDHEPLAALPYFEKVLRQVEAFAPSHSKQSYLYVMHTLFAQIYFETKQYSAAQKEYEMAFDMLPELTRLPFFDLTREGLAASEARGRYRLALILEGEHKYSDAARQLELSLRALPGQVVVLQHLADDHVFLGQLDEGAAVYYQALNIDPSAWQIHESLADLLLQQGNRIDAAAEYRQALDWNPGSVELSNRLGALLMNLGRTSEALEVYRTAVRK